MSVPRSHVTSPPAAARQTWPFTLADLPYGYDALEPHLDQKTLQVHHRAHHAGYVKKLNEALTKHAELQQRTLEELLRDLPKLPESIRTAVRHNGGGHLNHDIFWTCMAPAPAREPRGELARALAEQFGSVEQFRTQFSDIAGKHFASGWVALSLEHATGRLAIEDLDDHDVVTPGEKSTLLILDVWEHAYYVKFQNRRAEFIEAFWKVVHWPHAEEAFAQQRPG